MTQMTPKLETRLIEAAASAGSNAYAPYSRFPVGAALLTESGRIFIGCNVENASYGMTICAERVAATSAIAAGQQTFVAIALSLSGGGTPCGACRQFLAEFNPALPVLIHDSVADGVVRMSLAELLPSRFQFAGPDSD